MKTLTQVKFGLVAMVSALVLAACGGGGSSSNGTAGAVYGLGGCNVCAGAGIGTQIGSFSTNPYSSYYERPQVSAAIYGTAVGYGGGYGANYGSMPVAIGGILNFGGPGTYCPIMPGQYQLNTVSPGVMQGGNFIITNVQATGPSGTLTVDFGGPNGSNYWLLYSTSATGYLYVRAVNGMPCYDPGFLLN